MRGSGGWWTGAEEVCWGGTGGLWKGDCQDMGWVGEGSAGWRTKRLGGSCGAVGGGCETGMKLVLRCLEINGEGNNRVRCAALCALL